MITADAQQLEPGGRVTLFELDASSVGADQLYFHQHLQTGVIWWQGQQYGAWPIEATGFARTSDQQPAPRLRVSNIDGRIGVMCQLYGDLVGARIIRRQTLVKYLDAANFPPLRNMVRNSSFEASANATSIPTGWNLERIRSDVGGAISYVPSPLPGGGRAVRLEWNALNAKDWAGINLAGPGANYIRVEANADYVNSSYVRGTPGSKAQIYVQWLNSTGGTVLGTVTLPEVTMDGNWIRLILPARSRGDAVLGRVYVGRQFAQSAGSHFIEIDNVQFEQGTSPTEYQLTGLDLDASRNPTADPNEHFPDEIWFIERKVAETKEMVEFELATAIDLNGEVLPGRQIMSNVCTWLLRGGYRGPYCSYTGSAYFDINDNPVDDPGQDVCAGLVRSCKRRFGENNELPYGGFPAAGLVRT
ncbi:phage minor tail protein L [Stenotrophomonas maltophilia]|uniref:phage minor tail protein L n=1 Tax=Stenotrophomonas maltophilia TaxID=40324 RepID=UPI00200A07EF|nr:phage minor tail protein L [Stenotrophomonas maltophilia]